MTVWLYAAPTVAAPSDVGVKLMVGAEVVSVYVPDTLNGPVPVELSVPVTVKTANTGRKWGSVPHCQTPMTRHFNFCAGPAALQAGAASRTRRTWR